MAFPYTDEIVAASREEWDRELDQFVDERDVYVRPGHTRANTHVGFVDGCPACHRNSIDDR